MERYLNAETKKSTKPVKLGEWKIPVSYGGTKGAIEGRLEYKPVLGTFKSLLKSPESPAAGVKILLASAPRVPAVFIENLSDKPVTVLGRDGEPFARIGPKVEVNLRSPTYIEHIKAQGNTPTVEADSKAPPQWNQIQNTPRWRWLEFRAAAPDQDPSQEIVERDSPTTVKNWRVPILIGEDRTEIVGITQFVPAARLMKEASGGQASSEGGSSKMPFILGVVGATLAVAYLVLRPKKKPVPVEVRHHSRSTPKVRR